MKAVVLLLTLFLAVQRLQGQCSLGCLSCRKTTPITFECSVCDLHNNYALNDDMKCVKSEIEDCEIPSADHTKSMCLRCKKGFVFDAEQKKCVEVSEFHKVDNCEFYLALNHCQECASGYFIKDGLCSALGDSEITSCESYNSDQTQCLSCAAGKYVKANVCEDITKVDNCSLYSEVICDECETGFLHERNYYSSSEMNASLAHQIIMNQELNEERVMPPLPSVCIKQDIPHCLTYVNFSFCGICDTGFYLDANRNCTENPENEIPHCKAYSDATTCIECEIEYFLSSNECSERTMVDNCKEYEVNSSVCVECTGLFYLNSTDNRCEERVLSRHIDYCEERAVGTDTCAKCKDRFLPTGDNLRCLYQVENCNTYRTGTNFATNMMRCQICNNGYYPEADESECLPQDILNCHTYQPNENKCQECNNGFYYREADKDCMPRTALNCLTVKATEDKCLTCINGYYFSDPNCLEYTVENCQTLNATADSCDVCFDNHFKKDGKCFEYNIVGCLEFHATENQCTTCNSGFYLNGTTCVKVNLMNCLRASNTANECLECEEGYFLDTGTDVCKKIYVPHCLDLSTTFNECKPGGCEPGYWFDSSDGNTCKKISQVNCKTASTTSNQCTECEDGFIQVGGDNTLPCIRQFKPFCKTYAANSLNCTACEDNYYILNNECYVQSAEGCKTFAANSINCTECMEGYYLSANKCYPYTIANCKIAATDKDQCTECEEGFHIQNQGLTCVKPNIPNCAEVTAPSDGTTAFVAECTTCVEGFGLTETKQCAPLYLETHCLNPKLFADDIDSLTALGSSVTKTTAPFFECYACEHGYFPDTSANGGCAEITTAKKANCVRTAFNEDACVECENKYFPTSGTCGAITKTTCYMSDGYVDECRVCDHTSYSDGSNACTANSSGGSAVDGNCVANNSTTEYDCTKCRPGFSLYTAKFASKVLFDSACTLFTSSACDQCEEGYFLSAGTCGKFSGTGAICARKMQTVTTSLTDGTSCEKCYDYGKYYLKSDNTCTARTLKKMDGCAKMMDSDDKCEYCEPGKNFFGSSKLYGVCVKETDNSGTNSRVTLAVSGIENCLIYDHEQLANNIKHCLVCKKGFKPDTTPTTCVVNNGISFSFDATNRVFVPLSIVTGITNGTTPGISAAVAWHMDCEEGYVKVVGANISPLNNTVTSLNAVAWTDVYTNYDSLTKRFLPWANRTKVSACQDISSIPDTIYTYKTLHGTPTYGKIDMGIENCETTVSNGTVYLCVQCKLGYLPRLVMVKDIVDGTTNDLVFSAVSCHEKTDVFTKQFMNVEPPLINDTLYGLPADDMLNADSCADGSIFVANMDYDTAKFWKWDVKASGDTDEYPNSPAYRCVSSIFGTDFVENCQIYAARIKIDVENVTGAKCMACKPGFKPTVASGDRNPTACVPIVNCDMSDPSKNTWMNMCETCSPGFTYKYDTGEKAFLLDACEPTSTECLLMDDSDNCLVCNKGYELAYDKTCVPLNASANGCQNFGHGANFMHTKLMTASPFDPSDWAPGTNILTTNNLALLMYIYDSDSDTANGFGCLECSDYIPPGSFKKDAASQVIEACVESPNSVRDNQTMDSKCVNLGYADASHTAQANRKCSIPEEGYFFEDSGSEIKPIKEPETINCIAATVGASTICNVCAEGFYLDSGNLCVSDLNCEHWNTAKDYCLKCKDGYRQNINDPNKLSCIKADPNDPCDKWGYVMGCLRCKNGNNPITINLGQGDPMNTDQNYYAICPTVENTLADGSTLSSSEKLPFTVEWDSGNWVAHEKFENNANEGMLSISGDKYLKYCVPTFTILNCKIRGDAGECLQCDDGYYMRDAFTCLPGTLANCIQYISKTKCNLCGAGYYSNSGTCTKRTLNLNCLKAKNYFDKCEECYAHQRLDHNSSCVNYTQFNCARPIPGADACEECKPGYVRNNIGECVSFDNPACEVLYRQSKVCWRCLKGFYPNTDGKCVPHDSPGCVAFRPESNQCLQCEPEYFLEHSNSTDGASVHDDIMKCTLRQNTGCLVAAHNSDKCFSCHPGMYLSGNSCKLYTVRNCSLFNSSANECVDCLEGFFRDSNKDCVANADPNCRIMGKYNSRCLVCKDGSHFDSTDDVCKLNTKSCQIFNPNADECLTCEDGLWNDNGTCKRYNARNCNVFATSSDRCATCVPKHYLNGTDGNCYPSSDPNCEIIENYSDSCIKCYPGYFINDTKKCQAYTINHCQYFNLRKNACLYCNEGYYLDNDLNCKLNTQKNCMGYIGNMNKCATCQPNHYYSNGGCLAYTVENCRQLDFYADNCNICEEGHYKNLNTCKEYEVEHCKTFDPNMDKCASCDDDRFLSLGECHEYTVDNCKEFHPEADMCIECEGDEYFRNGYGKCQEVTEVENCDKYHKTLDECIECEEGSYMEDKKCLKNPSGVPYCKAYSTEALCAACEAPYYLKENQCLYTSVVIPLCEHYNFDANCGRCEGNAFLISNACQPTTNATCTEWSSPENCSKCAANEVLNTAGSTVICEASGITNCLEAEYSTEPITVAPSTNDGGATTTTPASTVTNICKKCEPGHYLQDNTCTATSTVADCSEYESETLCSKCNSTFILSKDKTSCTAISSSAGANCSVGRNTMTPECIVCKEGYFFNEDGVCTECQVTGCAICDVINLRKCRLCKSGYQMSELFYCEPIGSTLSKVAREVTSPMAEDDDNGLALWASGLFMMVLSLFMFGRMN